MPTISIEPPKIEDEDNKVTENEENPYKTENFSRWSDTQFEDGTCSLSFLKLCKNEEEKAKYLEMERIKLQNLLKLEIQKKSAQNNDNPFSVSKQETEGERVEA